MKPILRLSLFLAISAAPLSAQTNTAIPSLTTISSLADGDMVPMHDLSVGGTNLRKATLSTLKSYFQTGIQPLEATLTDIADGTITEDLVNTANPWADNEVADNITVTGSVAAGTVVASGFNGNLATTDDTVQEIAQKLDDLVASSGSVATDTIFDAAGDQVIGTGSNTSARVAIGTAGQLWHVNSGATAPEWTSAPSVSTLGVSGAATVGSMSFEGATADANETALAVTDPTADRTITLPDATGTVALAQIVTKSTASSYTIGTTDSRELYGGVIYVTGAATITIPAVAAGASFTVITIGAVAVSVDPNASDLIYLDGTALADGDKVTNTSTAGDIAVFTYLDGTGWYCASNTWTDGN